MPIENHEFIKTITKQVSMRYQIFVPEQYESRSDKEWPLIVFLHGINRRGSDIHLLDQYGLHGIAEQTQGFSFIVLSPQCPSYSNWPLERDSVLALVEETLSNFRVDSKRIYLTGFSMGGNGAWDLAAYSPGVFAAVVPLSGWYEPDHAPLLKDVPIWAFHGEEDDIVPHHGSANMVDAIQKIGGNIRFTSHAGLKHQIMQETYRNPVLFAWLLQHTLMSNNSN
jgi:predicted peptidase